MKAIVSASDVELIPGMFCYLKVLFLEEKSFTHIFQTPDFEKLELHRDWFSGNLFYPGVNMGDKIIPSETANEYLCGPLKKQDRMVVGSRVRITKGSYRNWCGIVVRVLKSGNVMVALNSDGSFAMQMTPGEVEPAPLEVDALEKTIEAVNRSGMVVIKRGMPADPMPEAVYLRVETDKIKDISRLMEQCGYYVEVPDVDTR